MDCVLGTVYSGPSCGAVKKLDWSGVFPGGAGLPEPAGIRVKRERSQREFWASHEGTS